MARKIVELVEASGDDQLHPITEAAKTGVTDRRVFELMLSEGFLDSRYTYRQTLESLVRLGLKSHVDLLMELQQVKRTKAAELWVTAISHGHIDIALSIESKLNVEAHMFTYTALAMSIIAGKFESLMYLNGRFETPINVWVVEQAIKHGRLDLAAKVLEYLELGWESVGNIGDLIVGWKRCVGAKHVDKAFVEQVLIYLKDLLSRKLVTSEHVNEALFYIGRHAVDNFDADVIKMIIDVTGQIPLVENFNYPCPEGQGEVIVLP